jgi:hypothetical protein
VRTPGEGVSPRAHWTSLTGEHTGRVWGSPHACALLSVAQHLVWGIAHLSSPVRCTVAALTAPCTFAHTAAPVLSPVWAHEGKGMHEVAYSGMRAVSQLMAPQWWHSPLRTNAGTPASSKLPVGVRAWGE